LADKAEIEALETHQQYLLADDSPDVLEAVSRMLTPEFEIVGRVS
jgi:hypothetical protein